MAESYWNSTLTINFFCEIDMLKVNTVLTKNTAVFLVLTISVQAITLKAIEIFYTMILNTKKMKKTYLWRPVSVKAITWEIRKSWGIERSKSYKVIKFYNIQLLSCASAIWTVEEHLNPNGRNIVIYKGTFVSNHSLFSTPHLSTMNFWTMGLKSSRLKILGLKSRGLRCPLTIRTASE